MEQLIKPINEKTGEIMEETDFLKHFPITLIDIFRQTVEGVKVLHSKNIGTFEQWFLIQWFIQGFYKHFLIYHCKT